MAELKEVLGGVLRDIVDARVTGDLYSKELSEEYLKDPILSSFPVPRAEIREATTSLKFSVNAVETPPADPKKPVRDALGAWTGRIAADVFETTITRSPQRDEFNRVLTAKRLNLVRDLKTAADAAVGADDKLVDALVEGKPDALIKSVSAEVYRVLTAGDDDLRKVFQRTGLNPVKEQVNERVTVLAAPLKDAIAAARELAARKATKVDLAMTRKELAETPEYTLSTVTVTVGIRNYEWSRSVEDGKEVTRLNPE